MRQILRTFTNIAFKTKPLKFNYATETKNVFVLPRKHLIHPTALNEVTSHIQQAYTVRQLAYLFRDNIKFFTDKHVAAIYQHIALYKLQVDDTMNSIIVPITIQYVNAFTIQNALSLGQIAICAAKLNIQNDKFWQAVFNKLDTQNVYKYLTHEQVAHLLASLVDQGTFINHSIIAKLSGVIHQQKAYYQHFPTLLSLIRATNENLKAKGPQTLAITESLKQVA